MPTWLAGFLEELKRDRKEIISNGLHWQNEFEKMIKPEIRGSSDSQFLYGREPKEFKRTIRRYLTPF